MDQTARPKPPVGQDPGTGHVGSHPVEILGKPPELVVTARIGGDELSAAATVAPGMDQLAHPRDVGGELERAAVAQQYLTGPRQYQRRGQRRRGHVDLPAVIARNRGRGDDPAPCVVGTDLPPLTTAPFQDTSEYVQKDHGIRTDVLT